MKISDCTDGCLADSQAGILSFYLCILEYSSYVHAMKKGSAAVCAGGPISGVILLASD